MHGIFNSLNSGANMPFMTPFMTGRPKAHDLLVCMTHGKEPAGLALAGFILDNPDLFQDLRLTIAVGNVEAAKMYFASTTDAQRADCRKVDVDMNRLPVTFPEGVNPQWPYEHKRAFQIRTSVGKVRSVLDLHSTDQESTGMLLDIVGSDELLRPFSSGFFADTWLKGIAPVQSATGTKTKPFGAGMDCETALEFESGQHESEEGLRRAVLNGMCWLNALGCVKGSSVSVKRIQNVYRVLASVMVPNRDTSYQLVDSRFTSMYAPVEAGEVIARNPQGHELTVPAKGLLIFGPDEVNLSEGDCTSELCWLVSENEPVEREILVPECVADLIPA